MLGLLVKALAANEKYPLLNRDNLTIPIQVELKDGADSFCISEIVDSENVVR